MQQAQHILDAENGAESLVFTQEAETDKSIPLGEVDRRWRILWLETDDARLDLRRRFEAIAANLDQVVDSREQLHVDGQSAVHVTACLGH